MRKTQARLVDANVVIIRIPDCTAGKCVLIYHISEGIASVFSENDIQDKIKYLTEEKAFYENIYESGVFLDTCKATLKSNS